MIAFDTDILSDIAKGVPATISRLLTIPADQQMVPIVAAEEAIRGQLATIRLVQTKGGPSLERAYAYFEETLKVLRRVNLLPYTTTADALFATWRASKVRIGTQDLRIAAIAFAHGATLVTRNARDYALVPGLALDIWP